MKGQTKSGLPTEIWEKKLNGEQKRDFMKLTLESRNQIAEAMISGRAFSAACREFGKVNEDAKGNDKVIPVENAHGGLPKTMWDKA